MKKMLYGKKFLDEKKIDKEVDAFFDEFVRNLSTSMRKL